MTDSYDDYEIQQADSIKSTYCKKHKGLWKHECGCENKKNKLKYKIGTVHPTEYDWKKQFSLLNPFDIERVFDVGKVYGLAIYCQELENRIEELEEEMYEGM